PVVVAVGGVEVIARVESALVHIVDGDEVTTDLTRKNLAAVSAGGAEPELDLPFGGRRVCEDGREVRSRAGAVERRGLHAPWPRNTPEAALEPIEIGVAIEPTHHGQPLLGKIPPEIRVVAVLDKEDVV